MTNLMKVIFMSLLAVLVSPTWAEEFEFPAAKEAYSVSAESLPDTGELRLRWEMIPQVYLYKEQLFSVKINGVSYPQSAVTFSDNSIIKYDNLRAGSASIL